MQVQRHLERSEPVERSTPPEVAVVLLHLGGPVRDEDIEPFYRRLWSEREVAPGLGLRRRGRIERALESELPEIKRGYHLIGGRSPVLDLAASQALALENRLNGKPVMAPHASDAPVVVRVAACFAEPSIETVVADLSRWRARRVVAVPLYAQANAVTSGLCVERFEAAARSIGAEVSVVPSYHDQRPLLRTLSDRTRRAIDLIPPDLRGDAHLVFAVHSPPRARADRGPYLQQVESMAQAILNAIGLDESRAAVAYHHSRAPVPHLGPSVRDALTAHGEAGGKVAVVLPLSYLTDCFETLYDLDIDAYQAATQAGVVQFRRVPSLNADPVFIGALADLVRRRLPEDLWVRLASAPGSAGA